MKPVDKKKAKAHLCQDPVMSQIIHATRLRRRETEDDVYLALVRSIVYQQLSGKAAGTIYGRFLNLFPKQNPSPLNLSRTHEDTLRGVGLSKQKTSYVKNVAEHWKANQLHRCDWSRVTDDEFLQEVTQIKGVGTWTAQMVLMFCLQRPDVMPLNDLGICTAITKAYRLRVQGPRLQQRMQKISEPWRPYRTLACQYLWQWLDQQI